MSERRDYDRDPVVHALRSTWDPLSFVSLCGATGVWRFSGTTTCKNCLRIIATKRKQAHGP